MIENIPNKIVLEFIFIDDPSLTILSRSCNDKYTNFNFN